MMKISLVLTGILLFGVGSLATTFTCTPADPDEPTFISKILIQGTGGNSAYASLISDKGSHRQSGRSLGPFYYRTGEGGETVGEGVWKTGDLEFTLTLRNFRYEEGHTIATGSYKIPGHYPLIMKCSD